MLESELQQFYIRVYKTIIDLYLSNLNMQLKTKSNKIVTSSLITYKTSNSIIQPIPLRILCSMFNHDIHKVFDCCIFRIIEKGREFHSFVPNLFVCSNVSYLCVSIFIIYLFACLYLFEIRNARYHSSNCSQLLFEWSSRN